MQDIQYASGGSRKKISDTEVEPLRVLRLSHSAGVTAYRERERQLHDCFDIEIDLIMPERWQHLGGAQEVIHEPFNVERVKTYGTGSIPLFAYDPISVVNALRKFKPHIVDIHEEPYSVSCFETVLLAQQFAPQAARVFYSAQNIYKKYPPPFTWTEQYVYRNCHGAYPCSGGVDEVLKKKGFNSNSRVIPLGVDPQIFKPTRAMREPFGIPNETFLIGYFGRFEQCKGIQHLLESLSLLSKDAANSQVFMVGTGPFEQELRRQSCELQVADRIIWTGEITSDAVATHLALCDVIAVPSLTTKAWKEQFGRVVVEAMACGVPVIAFDSGSLPEVIGDAGIIVPEADSQALANGISALTNNLTLRETLIKKGLRMVEEKYTWQRVAASMHDLYQSALSMLSQKA